jgi:voltage-gated potassium channel Kch
VLCGYGSFGKVMTEALENAGLPVTIIDRASGRSGPHWIKGDGTGADALAAAGIREPSASSPPPPTT